MTPRLTTAVLVGALIRRVAGAGGMATVLAKGDETAGSMLVVTLDRGANPRLFERGYDLDGRVELRATGPVDGGESALTDYWQRRRSRDPDLWVIELDVAEAERFAAETISQT